MHQKSKPFIKYAYLALLSTTYILHYYLYVYAVHWVEKTKIKSTIFEEKKLFTAQAGPLNSKIFQKILILLSFWRKQLSCEYFSHFCPMFKMQQNFIYLHQSRISTQSTCSTYKRNNIFFPISDILILCICYLFYNNGRWIFQM